MVPFALEIATYPDSKGSRSVCSVRAENSGASSMNQVEQSVAEYVDKVWEDVVADIEQLVSYQCFERNSG